MVLFFQLSNKENSVARRINRALQIIISLGGNRNDARTWMSEVLARLMTLAVMLMGLKAARAEVLGATSHDIIDAANSILDVWEQQNAEVRGLRVAALNRADGSVSMELR
jgi:hypothetical protein